MQTDAIRIVAIGDSITYGYPYEPALSWFNTAARRFNIECINRGINGDTTAGMVQRFAHDVFKYKPSYVIIMGGTNDVYAKVSVKEVMDNIRNMAEAAVKNSIVPVIGLPIPCNDAAEEKLVEEYRQQIRQYSEDSHIKIIDFQKVMASDEGFKIKEGLYADDVHPNKAGYKVMADIAEEFFIQAVIETRVHDYYWKEDFSCTITTLKILSELFHYELHPQVLQAAYGLNAGRFGTQCGLVEGALLFLGVYGYEKGLNSQEITQLCRTFANGFQEKFGSLLCKELRPQGFSPSNPPHLCESITKCAIEYAVKTVPDLNMGNLIKLANM